MVFFISYFLWSKWDSNTFACNIPITTIHYECASVSDLIETVGSNPFTITSYEYTRYQFSQYLFFFAQWDGFEPLFPYY
jgi:hypothetical protein